MRRLVTVLASFLCLVPPAWPQDSHGPELDRLRQEYADVLALEGASRNEILAIARILRAKPEMAIDRTQESGEYCLKSGFGIMTHYATTPSATKEDIVYEFDGTLLVKAGLDPKQLPLLPALGKMEPGHWYFLPEGQIDPHHQHAMPGPTLLIAVDVH